MVMTAQRRAVRSVRIPAAAWITVLFCGAIRSAGVAIQCTAMGHPSSQLGALLAMPLLACAMSSTPPPSTPAAAAVATGLADATERAIVQAVDAGNADALALLERIVNINSGTMNFAGVREVGDVLRGELDALGFTTRWVDGAPFQRSGHLVGERRGNGPRLLLIGHLDTVFEPSSPFQRFERSTETTARGPGVIDMKGGDVMIVHALKALKAAGALDALTIAVVFDGDEEHPGEPVALDRKSVV